MTKNGYPVIEWLFRIIVTHNERSLRLELYNEWHVTIIEWYQFRDLLSTTVHVVPGGCSVGDGTRRPHVFYFATQYIALELYIMCTIDYSSS